MLFSRFQGWRRVFFAAKTSGFGVCTLTVSKQALIIWTSLAQLRLSPLLILYCLGYSAGNQSIEGVDKYGPPLPPLASNYGGGGGDVTDSGGGQGGCRGGHVE